MFGLREVVDEVSSMDNNQGKTAVVETESSAPPKKRRFDRDLTVGSIPKNLWRLSWPQVVEGVFNAVDQLADVLWAGRIGATSIAGLGVAQSYVQLAMTLRMGLDTATRAMIARAVGAHDIAFVACGGE